MREIKFRAWDAFREQMIYEGWAVKFKPEREKVSGIMLEPDQTPNCERIYGEWNDSESIVLMQFTGLKDKNEKEIWEGDIIKNVQADVNVVNFDYGCWGYENYHAGHLPLFGDAERSEVIGNIYENPELIR